MTGGMGTFPERVADVGVGDGWAGSGIGVIGGRMNDSSNPLVVVVGPEMPWLASMYGVSSEGAGGAGGAERVYEPGISG